MSSQVDIDCIYLLSSYLHGEVPSFDHDLDYRAIYMFGKKNMLRAMLDAALLKYPKFAEADPKAISAFKRAHTSNIRKTIRFNVERASISLEMDSRGICYLPLKGIVLGPLYPELGLREFADNDIYFEPGKKKLVKKIFVEKGYTVKNYNRGHHDNYEKAPMFNFEMHRDLIGPYSEPKGAYRYFSNLSCRLIKDNDDPSNHSYHMSNEDFYLYFLAHAYKHYASAGAGIRVLLDCYLYLSKFGDSLNWDCVELELTKMGILAFGNELKDLSFALFGSTSLQLTSRQEKLLSFMLASGAQGNAGSRAASWITLHKNPSTWSYIWSRLWPGLEYCRSYHPFIAKTYVFIPFYILARVVKAVFNPKGRNELKELRKHKKKRG